MAGTSSALAACFGADEGADEEFGNCTLTDAHELNWTPLRGPYLIDGHVTVPAASELTIQAGTEIRLSNESAIVVEGLLTAIGSAADPISFEWEYPDETIRVDGHWPGIEFTGTSGGSQLVHARLDGGVRCVVVKEAPAGIAGGANPQILDNIFTNCASHAIYLEGSSARIQNNLIVENAGVGIAVDRPDSTEIRLLVAYNTIDLNAGGGIRFVGENDPGTRVENNIISRNGGIGWLGGANVTHLNNNIWGNERDLPSPAPIFPALSSDPQYADLYFSNRTLLLSSPSLTASTSGGEIGAYGSAGSPPDFDIAMVDTPTTSGALRRSERWSGEVVLRGSVTVDWPWRLEVAAGTIIRIPAEDEIRINSLANIAGAANEPAVFEGSGGGTRGTWGGLFLAGGSGVRHARISSADRCIQVDGGAPLIANSVITNCTEDGVYVSGGHPNLKNNLIIENPGVGVTLNDSSASAEIRYNTIDLNGGGGLDIVRIDEGSTTIEENIITRNGVSGWSGGANVERGFNNLWGNQRNYQGVGVTPALTDVPDDPRYVDPFFGSRALQAGSPALTWSRSGGEIGAYGAGGNPLTYEVPMDDRPTLSGNLGRSERWAGVITLDGSITVNWPWRLEIAPGTIVQIPEEEEIIVNSLVEIVGTSDNPVVFQPIEGGRDSGVWGGLSLNGGSLIRHAHITGAERCIEMRDGVSMIADNLITGCRQAGIYVFDGTPTIQNNLVIENANVGIGLYGATASPIIQYNTIDLNGGNGLNFQFVDDDKTLVRNNIITRNGGGGWSGGAGVTLGFNNLWRNNPNYLGTGSIGPGSTGHLSADPQYRDLVIGDRRLAAGSPALIASETGAQIGAYGNNGSPPGFSGSVSLIPTVEGELTRNERWSGIVELEETVIVNPPWRLEITPGTRVRVPSNEGLLINGHAEIVGTEDSPITFELLNDDADPEDPPPAPWDGLRIAGSAEVRQVRISGAERCIEVNAGVPVIAENRITECQDFGIYVDGGAPEIEHNLIINNPGAGIGVYNNAIPLVRFNTINGNSEEGLDFAGRQNASATLVENNLITGNVKAGWFGGELVEASHNLVWGNNPNYQSVSSVPVSHTSSNPSYTACPSGVSAYCIPIDVEAKTAASDGGEVGRYGDLSYSCSVNGVQVNNAIFRGGSHRRFSESALTLGGGNTAVQVNQLGSLHVAAPRVSLRASLKVDRGGQLIVSARSVDCSDGRGRAPILKSVPASSSTKARTSRLAEQSGQALYMSAPSLISTAEALPGWLQERLADLGLDLDAIGSSLLGDDAQWLVLETEQALGRNDQNAVSDIYHLDLVSDRLTLVSASEGGNAGNGPSRYPAADASGELILFQSEATDLVTGDFNGVSDIFLYDLALEQTSLVSQAAQSSAHPAIDAAGGTLLFDQGTETGPRRILGKRLMAGAVASELSLRESATGKVIDNHHPALSADGRYVAYLEQVAGSGEPERMVPCWVHLYDLETGVYHRQSCPAALTADPETVRTAFSPSGDAMLWYRADQQEVIRLPNPLVGEVNLP
ncbi:right-handed parallel beta-helix repeat-containing protein [Lamprobacter modestohalophilus]|uniref:right-handed parallel beta-helix repeat-containing protein n=1 Tax=Lamprobacter modestohalophilus TaxID=1064514 RepID=UPI002ADEF9D4|nr:right-handed parallel beta-helix repeat-containing protein [Lamprobacter modestohalophilus]MEA1051077.1 right-handed parallel beta-helix repeat-containing protein [Lamprobacter modestohalophilus]